MYLCYRARSNQLVAVMSRVASWSLFGVLPGGWHPVGSAVEHDRGPAQLLEVVVVVVADQCPVVDAGVAGGLPVGDVVGVGPAGWPVAAGEAAPLISGGHRE